MKKIIQYFSGRHLFTNFLFFAVLIGAVFFWNNTGKEELPNINFDMVRISASYPGATAENMDILVTRVIESALEGIDGILSVRSTSSLGSASLLVELDPHSPNRGSVVAEINDAVTTLDYPDAVDIPRVREFKSSRFSVIDLALSFTDTDIMTDEQRVTLQSFCDTLEDKLKRIPGVSQIDKNAYLNRFIEISVYPERLTSYGISLRQISDALRTSTINQPVGMLEDAVSTKIKLESELNSVALLNELVVRANFEGNKIRLKDLARVSYRFDDRSSIYKIDGNEAIMLRVTKSSGTGILEVVDRIKEVATDFAGTSLDQTGIKLHVMRDESTGVRNRLAIIASNGLLGFILVVIILFIFLDAKSSFWVAMGIPFTLASAMILASLLGQTVNNMTLAAVIVVMGMIVDDAIVVAENVTRLRHNGLPPLQAVTDGTAAVFAPIVASITTTCAAFVPLFFFSGRFGALAGFLPPVIFIMLGASLFEAVFILPSHLLLQRKNSGWKTVDYDVQIREHWFTRVENAYGRLLARLLKYKAVVFVVLAALLVYSGWFFATQMKFSMFPREESTEIFITGGLPRGADKFRTEKAVRLVEEIFRPSIGQEVIGINSRIARSRWGGAVRENEFSISIELTERNQRRKSNAELIAAWEKQLKELKELKGFDTLSIGASRFGQSSGSAIDIIVQESNDTTRKQVAEDLVGYLSRMPSLKNPLIEAELVYPQNVLSIHRELAERLGVGITTLASALRTIVSGDTVYTILLNNKEVDVILTVDEKVKQNMKTVLAMPIPNNANNLIPLFHLVSVKESTTPDSISKLDGRRTLHVYADLTGAQTEPRRVNPDPAARSGTDTLNLPASMTPLEIAAHLEKNLFPVLSKKYPAADVSFGGEIAETRESGNDFEYAVLLALLLIFVILALTLNSLSKPFIILLAIPFGVVGVILTLQVHGILIYGFFSAVGVLGLAGVVVNDSIVLIDKLEKEYDNPAHGATPRQRVAAITKTRLRAVLLTTITTVAALLPTAYGVFGYDSMLSEMMLVMAWGLIFGTVITLVLVPSLYCVIKELPAVIRRKKNA